MLTRFAASILQKYQIDRQINYNQQKLIESISLFKNKNPFHNIIKKIVVTNDQTFVSCNPSRHSESFHTYPSD